MCHRHDKRLQSRGFRSLLIWWRWLEAGAQRRRGNRVQAEAVGQSGRSAMRLSVGQVRLWSGLILFAFATTHFVNHAMGLVSLEAMQAGQDLRTAVTRSAPGRAILVTALLVHFALGVMTLLKARTWRLGLRNGIQLMFGLLIPIFLIRHVVGTAGVHGMFATEVDYRYALWAMWPNEALGQAALMLLVWVHAAIGLHHWLSLKRWYQRTVWLWYGLAVLVPALSYAGFVAAGRARALEGGYASPFSSAQYATIQTAFSQSSTAYYAILLAAVAVWGLLVLRDRLSARIAVSYADGPTISAQRGLSLLEISRANRVPHASVCGGRARCSTCRVRVLQGAEQLPLASEAEAQVLRRVGSPANVRLACQLRPVADLTISTLLPASLDARQTAQIDKYLWGVEQEVTIMFCDLRGFTRMSEGRLSFDVVFILNQFLGRMAEAIEDTGGFVDKFMGDGIMAIFGMDAPVKEGAGRAIAAARAMGGVLDSLNQSLREELPAPLSMGIGIHTGPVILGRIGAAHRTEAVARLTALGETVNVASRLESKTKDLGMQVAVSARAMTVSGLEPGDRVIAQSVEIRGLSVPIAIHAAARATDLPGGSRPLG
jgi:adenylate cyclase